MRLIGASQITVMMVLVLVGAARADLEEVRREPNLEKRSKLALENADAALKAAREAYRAGDTMDTMMKINEVIESVDLAYNSLTETGKNPRKSPKYFKQAEMQTRELSRKLDDFQHEMSYTDRPSLDKVKLRVQEVHDELLTGLMEGKKKK
jgi:Tfp pilus assembly protein PilX